MTLQAQTSNCSHKGGATVIIILSEGGKRMGEGVTLRKRACYTAPLEPLGCVTCAERALCLCHCAGHIVGGGGAAAHACPSHHLKMAFDRLHKGLQGPSAQFLVMLCKDDGV